MFRPFSLSFFTLCAAFAPVAAFAQPKTIDFSAPDDAKIAAPYTVPGGVAAAVDVKIENGALAFTNRAGGSFGVQLNVTPLDLSQISDLSFDYTLSSDAKVNIFLRSGGKYYAIYFSGPKRVRPGTTVLGDLGINSLSGHADIPLREWLGRSSGKVEEILIGNWDNTGYALAGIGGNGPGAKWTLDNLKLEKRVQSPVFEAGKFVGDELEIPARDLAEFNFDGVIFTSPTGIGPTMAAPFAINRCAAMSGMRAARKKVSRTARFCLTNSSAAPKSWRRER